MLRGHWTLGNQGKSVKPPTASCQILKLLMPIHCQCDHNKRRPAFSVTRHCYYCVLMCTVFPNSDHAHRGPSTAEACLSPARLLHDDLTLTFSAISESRVFFRGEHWRSVGVGSWLLGPAQLNPTLRCEWSRVVGLRECCCRPVQYGATHQPRVSFYGRAVVLTVS